MTNYGIQSSQPNISVDDAKDYQLNYSSEWPSLKIYKQGAFKSVVPGDIIVSHDLGYFPVFLVYVDVIANIQRLGESALADGFNSKDFRMYQDGLRYSELGPIGVSGYYYIFELNLEEQFTAPLLKGGGGEIGASELNADFGVRATTDNSDVSNDDLRRFSVNSSTQGVTIHSIDNRLANEAAVNPKLSVTHKLGYLPIILAYARILSGGVGTSPNPYYQRLAGATDVAIYGDSSTSSINSIYAGYYTLVLLKQPLLSKS